MGKIYYIKSKYRHSGRFYHSEKQFLRAISEKDKREVIIYEECESGIACEMFEANIKEKERDGQLKIVLGEAGKYEEAIYQFKEMFTRIASETSTEKKEILYQLKLDGLNKQRFSEMITNYRYKDYLLFTVSDSVEWYQTILRCHNFKSLPSTYYKNMVTTDLQGRKYHKRVKSEVEESRKENFRLAKESLKKKNNKQLKQLKNEKNEQGTAQATPCGISVPEETSTKA